MVSNLDIKFLTGDESFLIIKANFLIAEESLLIDYINFLI